MADFQIEPTRYTPSVVYREHENLLEITGRSFPENTQSFYARVEDNLHHIKTTSPIKLLFYFDYLNSSSIISILKVIKHFENAGCTLQVEWHFDAEDEEILNVGKDIERLINSTVHFCETA